MRIVALIAVFNERRFIAGCLEHLFAQGVEAYVIDNGSTDDTAAIARRYLGHGLVGMEFLPRTEYFTLQRVLARKQELAATLAADWFIHHDTDEIRTAAQPGLTLAAAIAAADAAGSNAVNFLEFTFTPTIESPDHDHPRFRDTMRWYYPFLPQFPHRLNAWKRQDSPVNLVDHAGHRVDFPGLRMHPESLHLAHYMFLSPAHAVEKFIETRKYDPAMVARGWHRWRSRLTPDDIRLPMAAEVKERRPGEPLCPTNPRTKHVIDPAARVGGAS
ncbi:MAG: glycosyltransferase family 2 protein [Planctomycetia bacterium]|nr:glycosyltransferase family 2 protein [Planctomycetia bacterium]